MNSRDIDPTEAQRSSPSADAMVETLRAEAAMFRHAGRFGEAASLLARAIRLAPGAPDAYEELAAALDDLGRHAEAADVRNELGVLQLRARRFESALDLFERILADFPQHVAARANRGAALSGLDRDTEAVAALRALTESHRTHETLNEFGAALLAAGKIDEAVGVLREAHALAPNFAPALNNLAMALERTAEAKGSGARDALVDEGDALKRLGRLDEAVACYRRALAIAPDEPLLHWNLAITLLANGRLREGWREYEWRWRWLGFREPERRFAQPVWRGETPEELGGALLVSTEQGFGDMIQFARYLSLLAVRGHRVILEVPEPHWVLFRQSFAAQGIEVIRRSDDPQAVEGNPSFAAHVSLMSLPDRFASTLETVPATIPYLAASPARIAYWRDRLPAGFRIGVVWAGRPEHENDSRRSIPFARFRRLFDVPGVQFVSLQKPAEREAAAAGAPLLRLGEALVDFAETAAVISCLDLVIAVDTSTAHLAGALAQPCWVLLPEPADWRWLSEGDKSAWYPTLRLYRQETPGAWAPVLERVAHDLAELVCAATAT